MRDKLQHGVPALLLGIGCVLLFGLREQQRVPPRDHMTTVALDMPGYKHTDAVIDTNERRVAGMDDYVLRMFERDTVVAGRDTVAQGPSAYVGYYTYQVQGKTIHSPKNCLPGAGWEPLESDPRVVPIDGARSITVNRYLLANKGTQALVYYWYQGRGRIEFDEYKVKWYLLRDAALYGRTEEALVRVVVPIDMRQLRAVGPKPVYAAADQQAEALARQLVPQVEKVLPAAPGA